MAAFANGDLTTNTFGEALTGMSNPVLTSVPSGSMLYRFVDISRGPAAMQADRPWWFEFETFQQIKHFAERGEYALDVAARLFLAVLHEYSAITGYVAARTTASLRVWRGRGSVQYSRAGHPADPPRMIPLQGPNEVYQLYIPGLGRNARLFRAAFAAPTYHRIA